MSYRSKKSVGLIAEIKWCRVVKVGVNVCFVVHRKHMERLRLFLETESWEIIPVKSDFELFDLHEFKPLIHAVKRVKEDSSCDRLKSIFGDPFFDPFEIACDDNDTPALTNAKFEPRGPRKHAPVLTSTSLEIFRLIG
ncbi:hypothetical protein Ciccas_000649 [Cichlidogyrus casuarinus]|uniref:Uncharacterized protein n=1 Tax=Cichlidogyrus casuarinus TaxID=1844966 RepID=A0ABD2QNF8_9PLAT